MTHGVLTTREELREALDDVQPGFVPTMGALHDGHLSLIARSASENEETVVSIFVNPLQFGDKADLDQYPRTLERDLAMARDAGATLFFAPSADSMYPPGFETSVEVGRLAHRWEGTSRPGHLRGVATVVTILLNLVRPARAYFGEKDYQQLQVIRRLHLDLALPGMIVGCPTVRDGDGLALSSRNARLSPEDRRRSETIPRAMEAVAMALRGGERNVDRLEAMGREQLAGRGVMIDYFAIVDGRTLEPLQSLTGEARLILAVEIGGIRLIDNTPVTMNS